MKKQYQLQLPNMTIRGLHNDPTLCERGIAKAAARMNWGYALMPSNLYYWSIPTPTEKQTDRHIRFKAMPASAQHHEALMKHRDRSIPKYLWDHRNAKPADMHFYHHSFMTTAIANSPNNTLNIVNGEPAVLTLIEAEIYNTLCFYSELAMPSNLGDFLQEWGVRIVNYYPDADATGYRAAHKLARILAPTSITLRIADLRLATRPSGDVNDLWIASGFDRDKWIQTMHSLPQMTIKLEEPRRKRQPRHNAGATQTPILSKQVAIDTIVDACIERSASPTPRKSRNWLAMRSPLRVDRNPSFAIDPRTGVAVDFALNSVNAEQNYRTYNPKELAITLGLGQDVIDAVSQRPS